MIDHGKCCVKEDGNVVRLQGHGHPIEFRVAVTPNFAGELKRLLVSPLARVVDGSFGLEPQILPLRLFLPNGFHVPFENLNSFSDTRIPERLDEHANE